MDIDSVVGYQFGGQKFQTMEELTRRSKGSIRTQDVMAVLAGGYRRHLTDGEAERYEAICEQERSTVCGHMYVVWSPGRMLYCGYLPWVARRFVSRFRDSQVEVI